MNVLITGVSKGIGNAILKEVLKNPKLNKVYACSSSLNQKAVNSDKLKMIHLDFLNQSTWNNLNVVLKNEPIHILINNAGYLSYSSFENTSFEEVKQIFDVNFFGPYTLIQQLMPNLKAGKAHVVNIGSMGGFQGSAKFSGLSAYSASKAALANLSECLANEFSNDGVKFNCLALGAVNTEMLKKAFPSYHANISPEKIAERIADFAFNWSDTINGKVIPLSFSTP